MIDVSGLRTGRPARRAGLAALAMAALLALAAPPAAAKVSDESLKYQEDAER